jgi:8-oxo-dGTP diphosphatase
MNYSDIDWDTWCPRERATLVMIIWCGQILLIHKKLGLGAGKFNGPGGRVEEGETPLQGAIREVEEEIRVTPLGVQPAGELWFQFVDGHSILGYVFTATGIEGQPQETREAVPVWFPLSEIPYYNMWADDRIWLPLAVEGKPFMGRFLFDRDQMLGCEIALTSPTEKRTE